MNFLTRYKKKSYTLKPDKLRIIYKLLSETFVRLLIQII